jgi:putative endonuclease
MRIKDALGRYGEDLAANHLTDAGLVILDRNWRCRAGEIDIIAADGPTLVFCEVKTRSSLIYGLPAEAVTAVKAARIRRLALDWLNDLRHDDGERPSAYWPILRFDVVSVLRQRGLPPVVDHLVDAF